MNNDMQMLADTEQISLDQLMQIRDPGVYLIKVQGDSMEGAGIFCGDILIVDRGLDPASGQVVVAALNQEPVVKTFVRSDGHIILRSENRKYPPRYIMESDEFSIWGVVTYSLRDHERN